VRLPGQLQEKTGKFEEANGGNSFSWMKLVELDLGQSKILRTRRKEKLYG
jgi:hypothetical protein